MAAKGKDRAPRQGRAYNLADMGVDFTSRSLGSTYIASIERDFKELDQSLVAMFDGVIQRWRERYNKHLPAMIRAATLKRSGKLSNTMRLIQTAPPTESGGRATWFFNATSSDENLDIIGATLEGGRGKTAAKPNYFVPLASWMNEKSRDFTTKEHIREDLSNKNTFWLSKTVKTSSGDARMVLMYRDDYASRLRAARAATKKKPRGRGRPPKVKSILAEVATAMYLVYDSSRAIFGSSRMTPRPKPIRSPLAAQFGITTNNSAPEWFSRSAAIFLTLLYDAIGQTNVRLGVRGAKVVGGASGSNEYINATASVVEDEFMDEIEKQMIGNVRKGRIGEYGDPLHWYN